MKKDPAQDSDHTEDSEQSLFIHFEYQPTTLQPLFELEARLMVLLQSTQIGEYDGHEVEAGLDRGTLFFYGPDAEKILQTIHHTITSTAFLHNLVATWQTNHAGQKTVKLS